MISAPPPPFTPLHQGISVSIADDLTYCWGYNNAIGQHTQTARDWALTAAVLITLVYSAL